MVCKCREEEEGGQSGQTRKATKSLWFYLLTQKSKWEYSLQVSINTWWLCQTFIWSSQIEVWEDTCPPFLACFGPWMIQFDSSGNRSMRVVPTNRYLWSHPYLKVVQFLDLHFSVIVYLFYPFTWRKLYLKFQKQSILWIRIKPSNLFQIWALFWVLWQKAYFEWFQWKCLPKSRLKYPIPRL